MVNTATSLVDKSYFDKLSKHDSDEICKSALCKYDDESKSYTLLAWGDKYVIRPHEFRIDFLGEKNSSPQELFYLVVIFYLLNTKEIRIKNYLRPDIRLCIILISGIIAMFLFKAKFGFSTDLFFIMPPAFLKRG